MGTGALRRPAGPLPLGRDLGPDRRWRQLDHGALVEHLAGHGVVEGAEGDQISSHIFEAFAEFNLLVDTPQALGPSSEALIRPASSPERPSLEPRLLAAFVAVGPEGGARPPSQDGQSTSSREK